jgi:hypothetical protein
MYCFQSQNSTVQMLEWLHFDGAAVIPKPGIRYPWQSRLVKYKEHKKPSFWNLFLIIGTPPRPFWA